MTPPEQALIHASGSTDPDARVKIASANWYGNEAMWVVLPDRGEIVGRLFDKIPPTDEIRHRFVGARRLDGKTVIRRQAMGPAVWDSRLAGPVSLIGLLGGHLHARRPRSLRFVLAFVRFRILARHGVLRACDLESRRHGSYVLIAGAVVVNSTPRRPKATSSSLSKMRRNLEHHHPAATYRRYKRVLDSDAAVVVGGRFRQWTA